MEDKEQPLPPSQIFPLSFTPQTQCGVSSKIGTSHVSISNLRRDERGWAVAGVEDDRLRANLTKAALQSFVDAEALEVRCIRIASDIRDRVVRENTHKNNGSALEDPQ